jgi:hypothetical protein
MNADRITEKLSILADAAKYDVSCASSGMIALIPKSLLTNHKSSPHVCVLTDITKAKLFVRTQTTG